MPKVELTDLLVAANRLTGFSRSFVHAGGSEPRTPDVSVHLVRREGVLPVLRRGEAAVEGNTEDRLERIGRETGVREQL